MLGEVPAKKPASAAPPLSEYEALLAAPPGALDAIPGAVYICDDEGWIVRHNAEAAELWGGGPEAGGRRARFCGSHNLYRIDGTPLPHGDCPMAEAVADGKDTRNAEVVIERPDGSRITALVNIRALRDASGRIEGAINCFQDISARKALQEELERKSGELEDFFENSAVGLHIVSGDGTILRANRAELEMLGYSAEEYIGRPITDFHVDGPVIEDILRRLSSGDTLDRYPARLRARDGSIRHVLITSNSRIRDDEFVNTRCFTVDVTERRKAEEAQRASDERLAATYEAATVGIAETDEKGRYVRVNDALCKLLGRTREEALSLGLVEITHPDDRQAEAEQYARQVRGEIDGYALEKRSVRPDGSIVHLEISSSSVRDEDGRFRFGVRVLKDVTERQQMQEEIAVSERRLRELLEALPAAVYTTDAEGRVTFFNQASVELAGREPVIGSDQWCVSWNLYRPDGTPLAHAECPMAVALREERPVRGQEAILERPDGSRINFMPFPTPLFDADGTLSGAINMLVDITDRKAAEMALEEESRTLETLNRTGAAIAAELDLDTVVQMVTDAAVELTGAQFGAFFYNSVNEAGESLLLYTISGVDRSNFERFPNPRNTAVFAPTFSGERVVRSGDIMADPRYGHNEPHRGMPEGHLPVRSYLAVPVKSRSGEVIGGLFFGHPETDRFTERHERLVVGVAAQAAVAIDNARLYEAAQAEILQRKTAQEALRRTSDEFTTLADNIPTLCWMAYADGHVFWYNKRWYEYTGADPDSQIGWGWDSAHDPQVLPAVDARWRRSLASGEPFEMTFPLKGADGTFRPFLTRVVPIRDEQGRIERWFGTNADVSEQVETGRQLELALAGTEALLHEVNHRVKNSLQIVTSLLMLQANKTEDPALKTGLLEARSRIAVVASLHQRLYSANEHDRVEFGSYAAELAAETMRSLGDEERVELIVEAEDAVVMPLGQAVPLALVVSELLTNALKYAFPDHRAGTITLRVARSPGGDRIELIDDGVGLPADFELDKPEGLGMRIVVSLVRQVRGTLTILRQERGAGFRIEVPSANHG